MNNNNDPNGEGLACAVLNRDEMMDITRHVQSNPINHAVQEAILGMPRSMETAWEKGTIPSCLVCDGDINGPLDIGMCAVMFGPIVIGGEEHLFTSYATVCTSCAAKHMDDRRPVADRAMETFNLKEQLQRVDFVGVTSLSDALH